MLKKSLKGKILGNESINIISDFVLTQLHAGRKIAYIKLMRKLTDNAYGLKEFKTISETIQNKHINMLLDKCQENLNELAECSQAIGAIAEPTGIAAYARRVDKDLRILRDQSPQEEEPIDTETAEWSWCVKFCEEQTLSPSVDANWEYAKKRYASVLEYNKRNNITGESDENI